MDRPPKINILTIGDTGDGPTVFIRQYCEGWYMPGITGAEGEPDTRTCVIEDESLLVEMFDISRFAGLADGGGVDLRLIFNESDALIAVIEPAKPLRLAWLEGSRFSQSKALIDGQKINGCLTETAVVLLWHNEESSGMTEEEQREVGTQVAQSYVARAAGDVEVYFVHAFSGAGVEEAVNGTVARVMQRKRAIEAGGDQGDDDSSCMGWLRCW